MSETSRAIPTIANEHFWLSMSDAPLLGHRPPGRAVLAEADGPCEHRSPSSHYSRQGPETVKPVVSKLSMMSCSLSSIRLGLSDPGPALTSSRQLEAKTLRRKSCRVGLRQSRSEMRQA